MVRGYESRVREVTRIRWYEGQIASTRGAIRVQRDTRYGSLSNGVVTSYYDVIVKGEWRHSYGCDVIVEGE